MPKINQEEYEVLKGLDDKGEWIARNYNGALITYTDKPTKNPNLYWDSFGERMEDRLFQFIQWEDESPYNIAELIEEYEKDYKGSWEHAIEFSKEMRNESEETEVKKNIEWLKDILFDENVIRLFPNDIEKLHDLINQLDEPEVLSQEWIDEKSFPIIHQAREKDVVPVKDLKDKLVKKQELPVIPKFVAEWYESEGKQSSWWNWFYKWGRDEGRTELETKTIRWMQDFNEEAFVNMFLHGYTVEKERKYYVLNNEKYFLLGKDKGHGFIFSTGGNSKLGSMERTSATFELTEQEIKDYDPRYMTFAKPIEELEE